MRPSCFFAKKNNCYVKYEHEDDAAAPVRVHVAEVALGKQSLFAISRRGLRERKAGLRRLHEV